jgi:hypothetical protein
MKSRLKWYRFIDSCFFRIYETGCSPFFDLAACTIIVNFPSGLHCYAELRDKLKDLYRKRDEGRKKELLEAIDGSSRSYEEIMTFIRVAFHF